MYRISTNQTIVDLNYFKTLTENSQLKPIIDNTYSFNEFKDALTPADSGHKKEM